MNRLKQNRTLSFIIIAIIYALASVAGILIYRALGLAPWLSLLIADVAATVITFAFSIIFRNASVYDPYWSVQPMVILAAYAVKSGVNALGILLLFAVGFWGIRLTANWAYTFTNLTHQDWRYTMLSETTGRFYPIINLVGIHLVPTLIVYGCTLPAVYAIMLGAEINALSVIFILVSVGAAALQCVSDIEMHRFRKNRTTKFIRCGLWKYSRHPNYLGEILMWWGIGLAVFSAMPDRWYLLAGALANTLLFLFVSIPMADRRQSRKEGFEEYRAQTRMLIPIKK